MKELKSRDFYYCYDVRMSNYLNSKGIPYLIKAKSCKEDRIFTLYQRTDRFLEVMSEYHDNKNS